MRRFLLKDPVEKLQKTFTTLPIIAAAIALCTSFMLQQSVCGAQRNLQQQLKLKHQHFRPTHQAKNRKYIQTHTQTFNKVVAAEKQSSVDECSVQQLQLSNTANSIEKLKLIFT